MGRKAKPSGTPFTQESDKQQWIPINTRPKGSGKQIVKSWWQNTNVV